MYGGRLPVHVRCLIDECANIGQIPRLEKLVATIRSREISACLVLQAQSQLKAIYKDNADTIIGNMDTSIFLGGKEPTTLKELAAVLGKETKKYKLAAGKTAKSILISCGARLAVFDIAELREVTAYDELELDTLGDRRTALFLIMSDTDDSFNFLISMCYTQLFNLLC